MDKTVSTSLKLPSHMKFLEVALDFIENISRVFEIPEKELFKIRLASEEAISNIIKHGLHNDINNSFTVTCTCNGTLFKIILHEKGKPFLPDNVKEYNPDKDIGKVDSKGLGIYLMKKVMDEIEFRNLGRKGKETVLVKYLSSGRIENIVQIKKSKIKPVENPNVTFREFKEKDAIHISECAYSVYGYSYSSIAYYPAEIIRLNKEGKMKSYVAESDNNEIVGHMALKYNNSESALEAGVAFIKQEYRGNSIFRKFFSYVIKNSNKIKNLKCVYAECVLVHPISQMTCIKNDCLPVAMLLAIFPEDLDVKDIAGKATTKDSSMVYAIIVNKENEIRNIFPPNKHKEIISNLFSNLKLPIKCDSEKYSLNTFESDINYTVEDVCNVANIYCNNYGVDTFKEIKSIVRKLCIEKIAVIYLFLDLENPETPDIADECEKDGFIFAGILPYGINSNHALILQYLNNVTVDFEKINVVGDAGNYIKSYVKRAYDEKFLI